MKSLWGGISIPTIVTSGCDRMCQEKINDMFDEHKSSSCSLNRSESVTAQLHASVTQLIIRRGACLRWHSSLKRCLSAHTNTSLSGEASGLDALEGMVMPEQRELIIQALIRVYHGKFPSSGVCKQVALQQAEACLELICKDIMIDSQSRE